MSDPSRLLIAEALERIERAAITGKRLTLGPHHARALVESTRTYQAMTQDKAEELASLWRSEQTADQPPAPSSGRSGSGTGRAETTGKSAGTTTELDPEIVERAASRRASGVVGLISRQRRPRVRP